MKKKLLTLGKKSLALVMTVMMLTTCWVFMPANHEHIVASAADTLNYSIEELKTHLTDAKISAPGPKMVQPSYSGAGVSAGNYANLLASPNYTNDAWTGTMSVTTPLLKDDSCDKKDLYMDLDWHVPNGTVIFYDGGEVKPKIPVIYSADPQGDGNIQVDGSWVVGSDFSVVNGRWYGLRTDASDFDYNTIITDTSNGLGTTTTETKFTYSRNNKAVQVAGSITFDANPGTDVVKTYKLSFQGYTSSPKATTVTSNQIDIVVVNYAVHKTALAEAVAILGLINSNPGAYTPASIEQFRVKANALLGAMPDTTYFNGNGNCNYSAYKTDAQAAINAWNTWHTDDTLGGLKKQYTITWDVDGVMTTTTVGAGTTPQYSGTPSRAETNEYRYEFNGWEPALYAADKNQTYKAKFKEITKYYTITFLGKDGNVLSTNDYVYNAPITVPEAPEIPGFKFVGWSPNTNLNAVANATYTAIYDKMNTVTFVDSNGNTIASYQVKDGEKLTSLPTSPSKDPDADGEYVFKNWVANDSVFDTNTVVNGNITVTPEYTTVAHVITFTRTTAATCTVNAYVRMECDCGYVFNDGEAVLYNPAIDPDAESHEGWLALGHDYSRGEILANSSTGNTDNDTHSIKCARYGRNGCNATQDVKHTWNEAGTSGATCTIPGTVHWTCSCGAAKDTTGALAPDNHVNTVKKNGYAATCTTDGKYDDTYCNDCQKIVEEGGVIPQLGHSFTDYKSNGDATCTADGTKTAKCDRCDVTDTKTDEGSKLAHVWENTTTFKKSDAVCETGTVYYKECSLCHASSMDITGETWTDNDATGHDYTGDIKDNENGTHSYLCKNGCGTYGYDKVKDAATECTYGEWDITDPDHHIKTCSACGYKHKESHKFSAWTTTDFYKNEPGEQKRSCSVCGREETKTCTYTRTHYPATCTTAEHTDYKCSDCGHGYSITGQAALGHDYTGTVQSFNNGTHNFLCKNGCNTYGFEKTLNAVAPCDYEYKNTATGTHKATCKVCNYSFNENCSGGTATCTKQAECTKCNTAYGTTAPHSYTGKVVQLDGDKHAYLCVFCSTPGLYGVGEVQGETEACSGGTATCTDKAVCDKCNDTHGDYAAHVYNGDAVKLDGDVHAYKCSVCNNKDLYGVGNEDKKTEACSGGDATCTALAVCTVCNDTHGALDTDDHKWGAWTNIAGTETHKRVCEYNGEHEETADCEVSRQSVIAPDCQTPGYTLNTCDICGHEWETEPTEVLGHEWSAWVNNEDGTHTRTCEREGCKYGENGAAKTETASCTKENADAVVTAPTCLDKGYTTYTCKDCGYEWVDDYTDATGHSYVGKKKRVDDIYVRTEKDCTTDWTYWYSCDNCKVSAETEKDKYDNEADLYWVREAASDHKYAMIEEDQYLASEADCEAKATYYYSCSVCKKSSEGTEDERTFSTGKKLGHNWVKPADDVLATYLATSSDCINDATYYYVCSRTDCGISSKDYDGSTWVKENSKSGHDFDHEEGYTAGVAATCTTGGVVEHYTCEICNKHFKADKITEISAAALEIAPLRHDYKDVPAKEATCNEAGYTAHKVCQREGCNYRNDRYEVIPAKGHNYTGEIKNNEDGTHSYLCVNGCGTYGGAVDCEFNGEYNKVVVDGKHYHEIACECGNAQRTECVDSQADYVDPTCTEAGYYAHTCDVCGSTWTVVGDTDEDKALGHNFEEADWVQIAGKDKHSRKCIRCDVTVTEDCSSINVSTSCGNQNVCDKCHQPFGKQIEHVWSNVKDDAYLKSAATCTDDAVYFKKCANCNTKSDKYIWVDAGTATGHTMLADYTYDITGWTAPEGFDLEIKKPTCGEGGLAINYCTECDYYVTKNIPKDESLHEFGEKVIISENCATGVIYKQVCKFCFAEITSIGESMNHEYVLQSRKYATCTEDSVEVYACKNCGDSYETHNVKAKGHTFGEPVEDKAATCKNPGRAFKYCSVCGASEKVTLPQLVHAWDKNNDGIIDSGFTPDATDNSYIYVAATDATCSADGYEGYFKCLDCSYDQHLDARWLAISGNYKPATGHVDKDGDGECDGKGCNKTFGDSSSSSGDCGCICHKTNWFSKIIYKILRFFWKIFGIGKACDCGTVHY